MAKTNIGKILFQQLDAKEIIHCHWKSNQHLKEALSGETDIDMLVSQEQVNKCEEVLRSLDFKRIHSQQWASYPGIEDWLGFDKVTGELVHLHLHYKMLTGKKFVKEQHLPWEDYILRHRIKHQKYGVYVTEPNIEILLLYVRISLKTNTKHLLKGYIKSKFLPKNIIREIEYLKEEIEYNSTKKHAVELFGKKYGEQVVEMIFQKDINSVKVVLEMKKVVKATLKNSTRYKQFFTVIKYYFFKSYILFLSGFKKFNKTFKPQLRKTPQKGGLVIAVVGCDGSGKSTITKEIQKWLSWKVDAHKLYLGSGDGEIGLKFKLLNIAKNFYQKLRGRNKTNKEQFEITKTPRNSDVKKPSFLRDYVNIKQKMTLAKHRKRQVNLANKYKLNGFVVITDRYPQNQYFGIYDGPGIECNDQSSKMMKKHSQIERTIYEAIEKEKPDLLIKLSIPAEIAHARKPDHNIDDIRRKAQITDDIVFEHSIVRTVDATESLNNVILKVKGEIWECL